MRRSLVLVLLLAAAMVIFAANSLEDLKIRLFGGYAFTLHADPKATDVDYSYLEVGLDVLYPVAKNLDLGIGLGFAYLLSPEATPVFEGSQSTVDIFSVFKYSVELDRTSKVAIRAVGGTYWPIKAGFTFEDLKKPGYLFGIGVNYNKTLDELLVGVGVNFEIRFFENKIKIISIPLGANFEINF